MYGRISLGLFGVPYHRKYHQRIVPPKGPYKFQSDKASQTNGSEGKRKERNGNSKDLLAAALEFHHLQVFERRRRRIGSGYAGIVVTWSEWPRCCSYIGNRPSRANGQGLG